MAVSKPILLVGEHYGQHEARLGAGFVGPTGLELLRMLHEAEVITLNEFDRAQLKNYYNTGKSEYVSKVWANHPEVRRTNVFNIHPPGDKLIHFCGPREEAIPGWPKLGTIGWVRAEYEPQLERLGDEIVALDPNLVICLGNTPIWALGGRTGVSKLRGTTFLSTHCVANYKCLVTFHPAAVIHQWELRPVTVIDLTQAPAEAAFPEVRRPACHLWVEPSLADIERFYNEHIVGCKILSADIETAGTRITCIGFAPRHDLAIIIPFDDERKENRSYWPTAEDERSAWQIVERILSDPSIPKVFQNGLYDIAFLWRSYGFRTFGAREDTMLLHHALLPESLKSLGFMGSVYTNHGPWKSERKGVDQTIKRDA